MLIAAADWWARSLAIVGIVVALVSPTVTYLIWRRSGSRLKVTLRHEALTSDRMEDVIRIEVQAHGSQPVTVRKIELGRRVPSVVVNGNQKFVTQFFSDVHPSDGAGGLRREVRPTDYVVADVPIRTVGDNCGWGGTVLLQAQTTRGDNKKIVSKVLKVQMPRKAG